MRVQSCSAPMMCLASRVDPGGRWNCCRLLGNFRGRPDFTVGLSAGFGATFWTGWLAASRFPNRRQELLKQETQARQGHLAVMPTSSVQDPAPRRFGPTKLPHHLSRQSARSSTHDSAFDSTGTGIRLVASPRLLPDARCPADHWPEPAYAVQKNRGSEISATRPSGRSRLRLAFSGPSELDQRSGRLLHAPLTLEASLRHLAAGQSRYVGTAICRPSLAGSCGIA